jgi:peroxiredoxin (alkyl hydroperoxide reductase subunit C)
MSTTAQPNLQTESRTPAYPAIPTIGSPAPDFHATSTHGPVQLSDFKGKWLVLFSHPADFTPVCTTELAAFARKAPEFERRGTQLVGVSVDSIFSHLEWVNQIEKNFDVRVSYPIIADLDGKVASAFGMIHPGASDTATVRAVFFIDPKQTIRALIYYPLSNGRSIDEVLRVLDALQLSDREGVATPEGWQPGDKVIVPPPRTYEAMQQRAKDKSLDVTAWWFSKKSL